MIRYNSENTKRSELQFSTVLGSAMPQRYASSYSELALQRAIVCLEAEGYSHPLSRAVQKERFANFAMSGFCEVRCEES